MSNEKSNLPTSQIDFREQILFHAFVLANSSISSSIAIRSVNVGLHKVINADCHFVNLLEIVETNSYKICLIYWLFDTDTFLAFTIN